MQAAMLLDKAAQNNLSPCLSLPFFSPHPVFFQPYSAVYLLALLA
jgi:hypothetical protein